MIITIHNYLAIEGVVLTVNYSNLMVTIQKNSTDSETLKTKK